MNNLLKLTNVLERVYPNKLSIRQLAKDAKVPYSTALRIINSHDDLFLVDAVSNIRFCYLDIKDEIVKSYLIVAERKYADNFAKKHAEVSFLRNDLPEGNYCLILFGSRASEKNREKSDFDLCVINKKGEKNLDFHKIEIFYKVEINTLFFSDKEFQAMLREKENNVAKEILKNHVVLHGEKYFLEVVSNGF